MGKRTSSELEEEVVIETEKKSKKEKKEKKDKKRSRDEAEPVIEDVVVEETKTEEPVVEAPTSEKKKISEDDFESKKTLFSKWLKETKEM